MTGVRLLACVWLLTHTGLARSELQFLERREGGSVVLSCGVDQRSPPPYGVYLRRSWLRPGKVLFMLTRSEFTVGDDDDRNRTSVSGDPGSHCLNVTLSDLRPGDTDRYYCEFIVDRPSSEDERVRGRTEFFLLVAAGGDCGCSSYSTLLYALSAAVAILLFIVLIGFVLVYQGKARRGVKSHPPAPIYEEMAGVKPPNRKLLSHHLEEIESSEYRNCPVKKSSPENQYESPSGALCSRT